jgi:hypothetical protein
MAEVKVNVDLSLFDAGDLVDEVIRRKKKNDLTSSEYERLQDEFSEECDCSDEDFGSPPSLFDNPDLATEMKLEHFLSAIDNYSLLEIIERLPIK